MFFDGYIGAPPTVTVCSSFFICANDGDAANAPNATAAAATVVSAVMRESFMTFSMSSLSGVPVIGFATGATEGRRVRMQRLPSQTRELAFGDNRPGGLSSRAAALRLGGEPHP